MKVNNKDLEMHIIEWWVQDEEDDESEELENYVIRCFGVTENGMSITCKITDFKPFYYIKVDDKFNNLKLKLLLDFIQSSYALRDKKNALIVDKCKIVKKKDLYGFTNEKLYSFVKLVFNSYSALMKSRYIFKKAISIPNVTSNRVKFKLYESNIEGFMRYCHIKDIRMAGWIKLPKGKYQETSCSASTKLEVQINYKDVVSLTEKKEIGKFLQASWDIEVYSYDHTFPEPHKKVKKNGQITKPNEIFQIATTYKYYGDDKIIKKHLVTLKKCDDIGVGDETIVVEECKNEKELIMKFVNTINEMDPDILYTYNGDSFDCTYLIERAMIYGLVDNDKKGGYVLDKLSRLRNTNCVVKKETFSSSAYGDSDFTRLYIPGRLNYDLLIHYKRGMKKYSSYKLDNIANEILKEGKNDVSAKDIFKFYEEGTPEKIKKIGEYCIQDTELLQKLVDKQLILTNIMQLANVTFVPIGFLTTRGQTIKVFSQLLRKARQMDFVVPHTNFNEDAYSIVLKVKNNFEDVIDKLVIGQYIEINIADGKWINCKIVKVLEDSIIGLSDTELEVEYYNKRAKCNGYTFLASRVYSDEDAIDDSFTGATVLEPHPGIYTDNVAILDFASLYPTIMISRNLCYSTFVMNEKYNNQPNVNYETIEWNDKIEYKMRKTCGNVMKSGQRKNEICGKQAYFEVSSEYFCRIHDPLKKTRPDNEKFQKKDVSYKYTIVQPRVDSDGKIINKGVLPSLLEELYSERKKVKKQMVKAQEEGNKTLADILDSTQMAIKVSLNSTYGFLGRCQGNLILKELGSIVTSVGRKLIEQSKEYTEGQFLDYIKQENLLTHTLKPIELSMTNKEKEKFLLKCKA